MNILEKAILFATEAHSGAVRKGGTTPYILHPLEAVSIAASMTSDLEVLAAAVLHDVVEDTPCTLETLRSHFGSRVAGLVSAETENKRPDTPPEDTWCLRKEEAIRALRSESRQEVKIIAMGDKLSNLRAMYRDFLLYGNQLWLRFHQQDPLAHCWYYREVGAALACLSSYPPWQEYWQIYCQLWPGQPLPPEAAGHLSKIEVRKA